MPARVRITEYPIDRLRSLIPLPASDANKYARGKLMLVGGADPYPGSVCLAAPAAYRMGAGYVEAFCAPATVPILQGRTPSAVARDWRGFDPTAPALTAEVPRHPVALCVGPGMTGKDALEADLVCRSLACVRRPVLLDGGALTHLATAAGRACAEERAGMGAPLVLTPHFGEASRLAHAARIPIPEHPEEVALASLARGLADAYQAIVVLKGPCTYIAHPGGEEVCAMRLGTPALAKAGTGDVLAGIASALLAQGTGALDAACMGALIHAEAGRTAASLLGEVSVMAEDVVDAISAVVRQLV